MWLRLAQTDLSLQLAGWVTAFLSRQLHKDSFPSLHRQLSDTEGRLIRAGLKQTAQICFAVDATKSNGRQNTQEAFAAFSKKACLAYFNTSDMEK